MASRHCSPRSRGWRRTMRRSGCESSPQAKQTPDRRPVFAIARGLPMARCGFLRIDGSRESFRALDSAQESDGTKTSVFLITTSKRRPRRSRVATAFGTRGRCRSSIEDSRLIVTLAISSLIHRVLGGQDLRSSKTTAVEEADELTRIVRSRETARAKQKPRSNRPRAKKSRINNQQSPTNR